MSTACAGGRTTTVAAIAAVNTARTGIRNAAYARKLLMNQMPKQCHAVKLKACACRMILLRQYSSLRKLGIALMARAQRTLTTYDATHNPGTSRYVSLLAKV